MPSILLIGDTIIDRDWVCMPKALSPEAPIVTWTVEKIIDRLGGAANVAATLHAIKESYINDMDIKYVGPIDSHAAHLFDSAGLLYLLDGRITLKSPSIKNRIIFEYPYRQVSRFDEDDNHCYPSEFMEQLPEVHVDICVVSDYSHNTITQDLLHAIRKKSRNIIVDPRTMNLDFYDNCFDFIIPNRKEALGLAKSIGYVTADPISASQAIHGKTGKTVILKKGSLGCSIFSGNEEMHLGPYRNGNPAIDPMGAGDTFVATFASCFADLHGVEGSVIAANKLAGISVTKPGCFVPDRDSVREALD